ncbi:MAG TPA: hypothetical protein PKY82_30710 [Pyrinomonadaceae bacterium]|nr:hypothetical protein [Pyrinomonadaceae bacterium]
MEIKRKFEMLVATKRRFIIRQLPLVKHTVCTECGDPMLTITQSANLLGINQRRIFQIIETGAAHFTETEAGALMICPSSLAAILDCEAQINLS